ncbi:MAG: MarR family winged helix-turn-helix transcriptional regulator [Rothia sp. (in: high G+C Gram-positive bacteria)]|nr:MarR family winged helix-turn-helix transcriptional regulator [Rothia sp. (in: high G+C Gram-positive bacteria)]
MDPLQEDNILNRIRDINFTQAQALETIITQQGITSEQGMMLGAIDNLDTGSGVLQKDIVARSRTTAASITSLLKGMETRGLIERRPHPTDSRQKTLHILPEGRKIIENFDDSIKELYDHTLAAFTPEELSTLKNLLTRVNTALTERNTTNDSHSHHRPDHL